MDSDCQIVVKIVLELEFVRLDFPLSEFGGNFYGLKPGKCLQNSYSNSTINCKRKPH